MNRRSSGLPHALRTSPTGRTPRWVVDEALGLQVHVDEWRSWSPSSRRSPRRFRLRTAVAAVVLIGLSLSGAMLMRPGLLDAPVAAGPGFPTPGHEAADSPLGVPLPAPAGGGTHAFVAEQADGETPVAYDPCRPVHYVIRPDNAPIGGEAILHDAFARLSAVTGLQFSYDGATDEQPSPDREPFQPDRYGDRWAPVVVAWQTDDENPSFLTDTAGEAGSVSYSLEGERVFVTGAVSLDEAAFDDILVRPGGAEIARAIVLHELGHLVGLHHVSDVSQLMFPSTSTVLDYAAGDLTGLSALGQGACVPGL